jgi:uncharacterized protein YkwD
VVLGPGGRGTAYDMRPRLSALVVACAATLPLAAPAAAAECPDADAQPDEISVTDYADSLICVVNQTRREWGRPEFASQRNLTRAAEWKATDMADQGYFSHTAEDGETLVDRLGRAHFIPASDRWRAGENLGAGRGQEGSPAEIVNGWMNSREHRRNLLDNGYTLIGIGIARGWPFRGEDQRGAMTIAMDLGWRSFSRRGSQ